MKWAGLYLLQGAELGVEVLEPANELPLLAELVFLDAQRGDRKSVV